MVYEWSVRCAAAGALAIRSDLFFEVAPGHLHFARAVRDGEAAAERVLGEREARWLLDGAPAARGSTSVVGYGERKDQKPCVPAVTGSAS